jgi:membrane associated rhomboid family serine protease
MRAPPPLVELPRFPVTAGTALLAIGATLAFWQKDGGGLMAPLTEDAHIVIGEYWRLVTSILLHAGVFHLVFNVYWLWVFGTLLEEAFGHAATLGMIVLFAAGSGAAEYALFRGGVGLSGVGYGFFALIWVLSRTDRRYRDVIDRNTINLFVMWFFICIAADALGLMRIANVAHAVGAGLGALVGAAIGMPKRRVPAIAGLVAAVVLCVGGAVAWRPWVNFDKYRGLDEYHLGRAMQDAGRPAEALKLYDAAVRLRPDDPSVTWWVEQNRREIAGEHGDGPGREALPPAPR